MAIESKAGLFAAAVLAASAAVGCAMSVPGEIGAPPPATGTQGDISAAPPAMLRGEDIGPWASYFNARVLYLVGHGDDRSLYSSECRASTVDGTVTTLGECTEPGGTRALGSLRLDRRADGSLVADFNDVGREEATTCNGRRLSTRQVLRGHFEDHPSDADHSAFSLTLELTISRPDPSHDCAPVSYTLAADYRGTRAVAGALTTFNGSGRGFISGHGRAQLTTTDLVYGPGHCGDEYLSGTSTIESGTDRVEITYAPRTGVCPMLALAQPVAWTLNGQPQGTVAIGCAVARTPGHVGWRGALGAALGCAALAAARGRRRRGA